ncbi:hypothetical protein D3875_19900 [Deinococcus cavernae]|uniref:Uncharacterized protein n=1 Tax=Deinococcus cavernae TaxID=2320857 RepID=A0A418VBE1_9DEIO|nr:hypothetical protein [Deinococcus cavernae]RJF73471.1 hypothetical protein D3875_19900 [Deinococcus cavernae]
MKRLLPLLALSACAPRPQPVQVWEGSGRVLLQEQLYRLTFTVNDQTHALRGQLQNRNNGVNYFVDGTFLPVQGGAEITAKASAGDGAKLNASLLGFGVSNITPKSDALLTGRVTGNTFDATLTVNGLRYSVAFTRMQ